MGRIAVDQLGEGMIVDDTVTDLHGTVLIQKGTSINHSTIKLLKMWGVFEVSIDEASAAEHPLNTAPPIDPMFVEEAKKDVGVLFQHTNRESPFVKELERLATNRTAKRISERG